MAKAKIHARNKGLNFEREIAKRMRRWFPDARRGLQFQDTEYCPDVINTPFFIECKRYAKKLPNSLSTLYEKYLKQAIKYEKATGNDLPVVLIYKFDRHPVQVSLPVELRQELEGSSRPNTVSPIKLASLTWREFRGLLDYNYIIRNSKAGE